MSLLIPAALGAAGWVYTSVALDKKRMAQTKAENATRDPEHKETFQAPWQHISSYSNAQHRGRFVSYSEDVDVNGARIFLVDYGNGAKTVQYLDPTIEL